MTAAPLTRFPPSQLAVIALVAQGVPNPGIAERLRIPISSVHHRLNRAMARTEVSTRAGLVALACRWGQLQDVPLQLLGEVILTPGGTEVLAGIAAGLGNKQIAQQIGRSEAAVKSRCKALFAQLGASDRAHAVLIAWQLRILPEATR